MNKESLILSFESTFWQKLKVSAVCLLLLVLQSCSKADPEEVASLLDTTMNCDVAINSATPTTELCINRTAGNYIYPDQFGGRYSASSLSLVAANGSANVSIPTGWYASGTITFADGNIAAGNVRLGTNLFGAVGTVDPQGVDPACVLTNDGTELPTDCSAAKDDYFYTSAYGGRGTSCINVGSATTNTTPCYILPAYANQGYKVTSSLPSDSGSSAACAVEGVQSAACRGAAGTYRYTSEYGGRSLLCVLGYNANACWFSLNGTYYISTADSSNPCTDNILNAMACETAPGRFVYNSQYGGRIDDCVGDDVGECFVTTSTKQLLPGANLDADSIKNNVSIFGIVGTFSGNGDWGSGAHRNIDTLQIGSAAEAGTYRGDGSLPNLPAGYRSVPKIATDDDGYDTSNLNLEPVDRTGWGSTTCGVSGTTILELIADCSTTFGANARWNGASSGNAGQGIWNLVRRLGAKSGSKGREVWRDERTGLLWSSVVGTAANWCRASGSSNATSVSGTIKEADPSSICDSAANQNQTTAESGCFQGTGFTSNHASFDHAGKVSLALAATVSSPAVAWRLPTLYDYEIADMNGLRFVMPDLGVNGNLDEWTATLSSSVRSRAWIYNGAQGVHSTKARGLTSAFRCVGR